MKIDIIQIGIIGLFIIAAWFVAFIDGLFFQFNLGFLIVFPFLLLIIYFFTRYNDNRWIFISSFLFLYLVSPLGPWATPPPTKIGAFLLACLALPVPF